MNFPGTATKAGTFTEELKDKESPEFKELAKEFCAEASKMMKEKKLLKYRKCVKYGFKNFNLFWLVSYY